MSAPTRLDSHQPGPGRSMRKAGVLLGLRTLDLLRAGLFGAVVPRLLGPEDFGRFTVLVSVALYFALLSGLGATQVMGRFVPALRHAGDERGIAKLFAGLLSLRAATGLLASLGCTLALGLWLSDLPRLAILLTAITVALRSPANAPFALFLGLDQADRWGFGELVRRWCSLALLLVGTLFYGLPGALAGLALAELIVLGLGLYWAREWLRDFRVPTLSEWRPYARYNALFFASNALFALAQHGTGPLIRAVSGGYEAVAWFGAAYSAYLIGVGSLHQVSTSFAPLFSSLRASGQAAKVGAVAERMLLGVGVVGVTAILAATLIGGDIVSLVLGPAFAPAGPLLAPLALAVALNSSGQLGRVLALTWDRPQAALVGAAFQVGTLVLAGPFLVREWGALGGAFTVLTSAAIQALYWIPRLKDVAPRYALGLGRVLALGLPFVLAAGFVPGRGLGFRLALLAALLAGCAATLAKTRVLTLEDLRLLRQTWREAPSRRATTADPDELTTG